MLLDTLGFRVRGSHALRRAFPCPSATVRFSKNFTGHPHAALQPRSRRFGLLPFRSPLLRESLLISSPKLLRWFTSLGVAPAAYFIRPPGAWPSPCGLPHSDVRGSKGMCPSPRPFAACRVLHRLTAPQASAMNLCLPGHILPPAPLRRIQGYVSHFHASYILHHGTASRRAMLLCFPSLLSLSKNRPTSFIFGLDVFHYGTG